MQRITLFKDGNWYAINDEGIEVSGYAKEDIIKQLTDMINEEPDEATKRIREVKEEAENKIKEVEEHIGEIEQEKTEMLQPIRTLLKTADDEIVLENSKYLERYEEDKEYKINDLFVLGGKVFRVIQDHTSQADWNPFETPALYQDLSSVIDEEGNEVVSDWKQPTGGHDLYEQGNKVIYEDKTWELVGKDTGHAPGTVAGVWEVVE